MKYYIFFVFSLFLSLNCKCAPEKHRELLKASEKAIKDAITLIKEKDANRLSKRMHHIQEAWRAHREHEVKDLPPLTVAFIDGVPFISNLDLREIASRNNAETAEAIKQTLNDAIDTFLKRSYLEKGNQMERGEKEIAQRLIDAFANSSLSNEELAASIPVKLKEIKDAYAIETFAGFRHPKEILEEERKQHKIEIFENNLEGI